jgi:hypothetical protein
MMMSRLDLLAIARGIASGFEGVAIESIVELEGMVVELRLSVPSPAGGQRHDVAVRIRRGDDSRFAVELRGHIRSALMTAWSRPRPQFMAPQTDATFGRRWASAPEDV